MQLHVRPPMIEFEVYSSLDKNIQLNVFKLFYSDINIITTYLWQIHFKQIGNKLIS